MNSIPAASNEALIASNELLRMGLSVRGLSTFWIVLKDSPLAPAKSAADQPSAPRAALICEEDIKTPPNRLAHFTHKVYKIRMYVIRHDWKAEFKRLEGAYAPTTIKSYLSDVGIFVDWCTQKSVPLFPASVASVCTFLEAQAPALATSTVRRRVYSIRKIHRLLRLPDPTWDEEVSISLRRIRRAKLGRPRQAKGMTREYRDAFLAAQPDSPWGLRNRAMIALGYDLLTRRSELVAIRTSELVERGDGTLRVLIRRSKADPFGHGRISFTSRSTATLLGEWLRWRGAAHEYLFCPIYKGIAVNRSLSATTVKRLIKQSAVLAGLDKIEVDAFSGHSMRVGAAQDLLCAGHDTAAIMRAGGWRSINVLGRYLELAEHNVWA